LSHGLPGQRAVTSADDRATIEKIWNVPPGTIRAEPGLDAVALFKKMEAGEVKALWVIGTNPVASMPNRARVIAGLQRAELVIVQDAYHPTETSRYADILLPGALWAEADGTMVNSERNVTLMPQAVPPPGEAMTDWQIVARVAQLLGFGNDFNYKSASAVFDEIARTWNSRTGYDLRGMDYDKLSARSLQWPCAPDGGDGKSIRYLVQKDGKDSIRFATESGRGNFFARPFLPPAEMPDAEFPFALTNGRLAHQWHTMTKTGKVATLNKLNSSAFVEIHPEDAERLGVEDGALVKVGSRRGFAVYPAQVTTRMRPGDCFAPIHWNDQFGENLCVNAATNDACDAISLQPEFKFTAVVLGRFAVKMSDDFTPGQKKLLQELLSHVSNHYHVNGAGVPVLPESAPFTDAQRKHISELFAKLCASDSKIEKCP
jgi:sulfite reductase (NADPH) flavoprotein alpha-component